MCAGAARVDDAETCHREAQLLNCTLPDALVRIVNDLGQTRVQHRFRLFRGNPDALARG
ncbi:MAG: hypothetical protein LBS77_03760 [Desulfovibrio sp.]|nr:hypothetical protein [Desulfovibrio sp.]